MLVKLVIGAVVGLAVGIILSLSHASPGVAMWIGFFGEDVFISLLKLIVLPFVCFSVMAGVSNMSKSGQAIRLGSTTAAYYLFTTMIAGLIGLLVVLAINPGIRAPLVSIAPPREFANPPGKYSNAMINALTKLFPSNVVQAALEFNIIGLITFSCLIGAQINHLGPHASYLKNLITNTTDALHCAISWVVDKVTAIGVGSLIAKQVSILGVDSLGTVFHSLGLYFVTILIGLFIHSLIVLPLFYWLACRKNPYSYMRAIFPALLTAFTTDSSAATLPVSLMVAKKAGAQDDLANFVLSLGMTVNMNGTALYEALAAVFIAQSHGESLSAARIMLVLLSGTLVAVGCAAVPNAGVIALIIVLQATGLSQYEADIASLLMIDWIAGRLRTTVNVLGDLIGCAIIQSRVGTPTDPTRDASIALLNVTPSDKFAEITEQMPPHLRDNRTVMDFVLEQGISCIADFAMFSRSELMAQGIDASDAIVLSGTAVCEVLGLSEYQNAVLSRIPELPNWLGKPLDHRKNVLSQLMAAGVPGAVARRALAELQMYPRHVS